MIFLHFAWLEEILAESFAKTYQVVFVMKISVITVNRNNYAGLRKTIESVVGQSVRPFEFIVIDGASTDGQIRC